MEKTSCSVCQNFENFVVSPCNKAAYDICKTLVEKPQAQFVALYGPASCGKTHLLSAVNNAFCEKYPGARVKMTSFNVMISKFLEALHEKTENEFRADLCKYDLLIVDDMQCAVGKTTTQEEIAGWITAMLSAGKMMSFCWSISLLFERTIGLVARNATSLPPTETE